MKRLILIWLVTEKFDPSRADPISSPVITTPADISANITEEEINTNESGPKAAISEYLFTSSSSELSFRGNADIRDFPKVKQQENKRKHKRKDA